MYRICNQTSKIQRFFVFGPLLFIMHFNAAHTVLQNSKIITNADDTVIFVSGSSLDEVEGKLNNDLKHLKA